MENKSDQQLVVEYRRGKQDALAALIKRHLVPVHRFLFRFVQDARATEDLTQETFFKAWRHLWRYDAAKPFKTWLFAIAKNIAIDHLRKKHPIPFSILEDEETQHFAENIPDERITAPEEFDRQVVAQEIQKALAHIPPKARAIILMHESEDMTFQEIAGVMNEPMNTVKSRYRRAMEGLKELMKHST